MWRLEGGTADLGLAWLAAAVNVLRPQDGLQNIRIDEKPIGDASILQVRMRDVDSDEDERPTECYVRGADLVAQYAQTERANVSPQIYWRAVRLEAERSVGVELITSVQSSLLDSDPSVAIGSTLPASDVWWLADPKEPRFERAALADTESLEVASDAAAGLFLFRLRSIAHSYVEMIRTADFTKAEVTKHAGADGEIRSAFRIFDERLEKGVIRQARLRGVFVPREGDQQAAVECYHRFVRSAVPLTA